MSRRTVLTSTAAVAVGIGMIPLMPTVVSATDAETGTQSRDINKAVARYLAAWNERDVGRRRCRSRAKLG